MATRAELAATVLRAAAAQRRRLAEEMVADLLREADELDAAVTAVLRGAVIGLSQQAPAEQVDASVEWGGDGVTYGAGPAGDAGVDPEELRQALETIRPATASTAAPARRRAERVSPDQMPRLS